MKKEKGMKSVHMPKEHWEVDHNVLEVCKAKYAGKDSMDNPEELTKANNELVRYVETHRMKY